MFGKSFGTALVIRYLLQQGLPYLEAFSDAKKIEVKAWVEHQVPGDLFDAAVWSVIDKAWDLIVAAVKVYLATLGQPSVPLGTTNGWFHAAAVLKSVKNSMATDQA